MSDTVARRLSPAALGAVTSTAGVARVLEIPPQYDPTSALAHKYPAGLSGYITGISFQAPAAITTAGNLHCFITDGSTSLTADTFLSNAETWLATNNGLCCFNSADFPIAATGTDGGKTFYAQAIGIETANFSSQYPKWLVLFTPTGGLAAVTGLLPRITYATRN